MTRVASILFWSGLTLAASLVLYGTSNRSQELNKQLRALNLQIEAEQTNIHVLKAEWVYLANPTRIEQAARKYLAMHPTAMKQIASLDDLPEILPTPKEEKKIATGKNKIPAHAASMSHDQPVAKETPHYLAASEDATHVNNFMHILPDSTTSASAQHSLYSDNSPLMAESSP